MSVAVDLRGLAVDRSTTGSPKVRTRRHMLTRYVLPSILILGFVSLVMWASWDKVFPPRAVTVAPVFSSTAAVQREGTPLFKAAGWIEPRPTPIRVAALAPGVVEKLLVVQDQPVKANEPVAELVKDDAKLALDRALADLKLRQAEQKEIRAQLQAAKTRLAQPVHLEATLREAEAMLAKTETLVTNLPFQLQRAEAEKEAFLKDYESQLTGAGRGAVSPVELAFAKSKFDSATALAQELRDRQASLEKERDAAAARCTALRTQLELLADEKEAMGTAAARENAAAATVEQAEVAVAEAQLRFDRMTIRAPIEGRIYRLVADPGARMGGDPAPFRGQDGSTVVTMYRPDMLQVRVDVRFEDIPKVQLNQPVEIDNPALSAPITGEVLFISSEADIQKNTLQVKVGITDPPPVFKPEMLVDVTFLAPKEPERKSEPSQELRLYVPSGLVQQGDGGSYIWVADQSEGIARKILVETGATGANGLVEITRGLNLGTRLIVGGSEGLQDGDRIRVTGEDPASGLNSMARNTEKSSRMNRLPGGTN